MDTCCGVQIVSCVLCISKVNNFNRNLKDVMGFSFPHVIMQTGFPASVKSNCSWDKDMKTGTQVSKRKKGVCVCARKKAAGVTVFMLSI